MAKFTVTLSSAEVGHLLTLLHECKEDGSYYGNRARYYARTDRLIDLLDREEQNDTSK
jgi:hypothetical protein